MLASGQKSKGRVLIVDREPSADNQYFRSLSGAGFEVTAAMDEGDAVRRIERDGFDVVLSNVSAPDNGLELLRHLRERSLDIRVILMLDAPNNRVAVEADELGAVPLVKPIDPESLEKTVDYSVRLTRSRWSALEQFARRLSEPVRTAASVSATALKNEFGRVLEMVFRDGVVVITKHDVPKAVLISMDKLETASRASGVKLNTLTREFDALFDRMQTPKARAAMKAAYQASPKELAAALAESRKRG